MRQRRRRLFQLLLQLRQAPLQPLPFRAVRRKQAGLKNRGLPLMIEYQQRFRQVKQKSGQRCCWLSAGKASKPATRS